MYESTGIQLLTDLNIMNTCETITDAVSENEYELNIRHEVIALSMSAPMLQSHINYGNTLKIPISNTEE